MSPGLFFLVVCEIDITISFALSSSKKAFKRLVFPPPDGLEITKRLWRFLFINAKILIKRLYATFSRKSY